MNVNRKEFFSGCCVLALLGTNAKANTAAAPAAAADPEKEFVKNWMEDLFAALDTGLDEATKVKVMAGCGVGCFRRHSFKTDIARDGNGDLGKLIEAYKRNFEVWREGDRVHVRYGAVSTQCYCPAARYHPVRPHDMHCECTRATHQAIFETALEWPVEVEIVESLRRGGKTCHFIATV
ncbi:MAG TPA: hypothetical protein VMU01_07380 [Rhizomicrobium sp.]|nr:hypothetical protein [Rhizomicrobium sp.]